MNLLKPFIILRLYGGLGNQLFSYSAALRLSVYNQVPLYIDARSGFIRDSIYKRKYRLDVFEISGKRSIWAEVICFFLLFIKRAAKLIGCKDDFLKRFWVKQEKLEFEDRILNLKLTHPIIFEGYWQSEKYFIDIDKRVRSEFLFPGYYSKFMENFPDQNIFQYSVAIHVRHFNNPDHFNQGNIGDDYYLEAINYFENLIPNVRFWIFSDFPKKAQDRLFKNKNNHFVVSDYISNSDETVELFFMSKFKYFILSNSTFSWWGAWLSQVSGKIVLAPAEKINSGEGAWGFDGLIPEQWVKI